MKFRKLKYLFFAVLVCMGLAACGGEEASGDDWNDDSYLEYDASDTIQTEIVGEISTTKEPEIQDEDAGFFLKGMSNKLLSFEEVHFFGHDTRT